MDVQGSTVTRSESIAKYAHNPQHVQHIFSPLQPTVHTTRYIDRRTVSPTTIPYLRHLMVSVSPTYGMLSPIRRLHAWIPFPDILLFPTSPSPTKSDTTKGIRAV
eukprot:2228064-Pyramimonas_sp.AAC.1